MLDIIEGSVTLIIALVISLLFYRQLEPKWFRLFPFFLILNLIFQIAAYYYLVLFKGKSDHVFYNLFIVIEYGFYMLICYKAVSRHNFKQFIIIIGVLFGLIYCCRMLLPGHFFVYDTFSRNLGALLSFLCCVIFLIEMLISDEIINFFTLPMFWITTGIMMANIGTFLYFSFFDYILKNNLDHDGTVYMIIANTLSILEYGFFCMGLLCERIWKKIK